MRDASAQSAEKWEQVLAQLWQTSRFTSYFFQAVGLVPDDNLPTLALIVTTHRFSLIYNPRFIKDIQDEYLLGLLIHEMLHVILSHDHRADPGHDPFLQNLAQDMVINTYLAEHENTFFSKRTGRHPAPLVLPPGLPRVPPEFLQASASGSYLDYTWEDVYAWLYEKQRTEDIFSLDAPPGSTSLFGHKTASWQEHEAGPARHGLAFAQTKGELLPAGMHIFDPLTSPDSREPLKKRLMRFIQAQDDCREERIFQELAGLIEEPRTKSEPSWKAAIKSMVHKNSPISRFEYSYARFNRRFFAEGIYAPGRQYRDKPLLTVAVDVSGSMAAHPAELETAFGVIEDLLDCFCVSLVCLDQDVFVPEKKEHDLTQSRSQKRFFYKKGDWRFIRTGSRGTTFFAPLFNKYLAGHRELLVVMTDGYIYDLERLAPYVPTLWVLSSTSRKDFLPPFGSVVAMDETL